MALIIRGKLPVGKGCDECEFQTSRCEQLDACTCFLFNGCIHNFHNERHKDCPIIGEIPDKHGDLIDEDEFRQVIYREIRNHKEDEPITMILKGILWEMDNAPVIVEASR